MRIEIELTEFDLVGAEDVIRLIDDPDFARRAVEELGFLGGEVLLLGLIWLGVFYLVELEDVEQGVLPVFFDVVELDFDVWYDVALGDVL